MPILRSKSPFKSFTASRILRAAAIWPGPASGTSPSRHHQLSSPQLPFLPPRFHARRGSEPSLNRRQPDLQRARRVRWSLWVRGSFFDQSCDFLRLGNINSVTPSASKVWQRLEIRRQLFCRSLTTRDTLFPLLFPAPRRAFHHQRLDLLDPDKLEPKNNEFFLMVEPGSGRRRVFRVGPAPRVDHEGAGSLQQRTILPAVIGKEHVPLTGQINQLLELVGVCEVPHWHAEHDAVRLLEADGQLLDFVADGGLGLIHRIFVHAFVLRSDPLPLHL